MAELTHLQSLSSPPESASLMVSAPTSPRLLVPLIYLPVNSSTLNSSTSQHLSFSATNRVFPNTLISSFRLYSSNLILGKAPQVLKIPIQPGKLLYHPYDPSKIGEIATVKSDFMVIYDFPERPTLRPLRMEVFKEADVRGDLPARVCLLESNKTTLRSFAIPNA